MNAWPAEVAALIEAALDAHLDPEGGAAWLACHAPEAWLLAGRETCKQAALDREAFALAHQLACGELMSAGRGVPRATRLEAGAWRSEPGDRGIASGRLLPPGEAALALHAGVRTVGAAPRLAWMVVTESAEPPPFSLGEATSLAGFADLAARGAVPARSFLDLAFDRLHRRPEPPLSVLPEQRFACHASTACCRLRYEIDTPPAAQAMIDALPWAELGAPELVGTRLPALPSGLLRVREAEERCRFLDAQDRCRIHLALGTPVFSACVAFPLRFTATSTGYAVSTSYFCGSARGNLGPALSDRHEELWRRLAAVGPTVPRPATLRLRPGEAIPPATFDALVEAWLACVPADGADLVGGLNRAGAALQGQEPTALTELEAAEAAALEGILGFWLTCLGLIGGPLTPLAGAGLSRGPARQPAVLARWLRTTWHARELAYALDLQTAHQLQLVLLVAVLALEAHHDGPLPEEAWASLGAITSHGRAEAVFEAILSAAPMLREAWEQPATGLSLLRWLNHPPA